MGTCDQRHDVWALFLKTYSALTDTLDAELTEAAGMPLTWFDVLVHLVDAPDGRMRMQDLSAAVLLSKSGVTRLVDRMERSGLITRGACPTDRRVVYAVLTPTGRAAFDAAAPIAFGSVQHHFARHLRREEAAALRSFLGRVLESLAAERCAGSLAQAPRTPSPAGSSGTPPSGLQTVL
jgi:DNA-binding MarR family transcriptional regulator